MDWKKNSNICKTLYRREFQDRPSTCGKIISDRLERKTDLLYKRDLLAHYGCVNAVEFSNNGQFLVSGGDDRRVLLWNVQKALHNFGKPAVMKSQHRSNIFCLAVDNSVSHIYSAGNDDQVILHNMQTGKAVDVFNLQHPIYGISVDPCNDNIFATAAENGCVLIFDTRLDPNNDPYQLARCKTPFHAVMFNPRDPRLITTANSKEGAALWDIRVADKVLLQYSRKGSCMNVRWNQSGTNILALRRRQTPVLYDYRQPEHIVQFCHENYYNSCTMKSCSFAGLNDEYVLSGSDDFNMYMWKIDDAIKSPNKITNTHLILQGHRSIVNQIRFDPHSCVIASSGVEKLIKIWSPMFLPFGKESGNCTRRRYTNDEYITLATRQGFFMHHDYSEESTAEDPLMMAFFDSLVEREREGMDSESDDSTDDSRCEGIENLDDADYSSLSTDSGPHIVTRTTTVSGSSESHNSERFNSQHQEPETPPVSLTLNEEEDYEGVILRNAKFRSYFDSVLSTVQNDLSSSSSSLSSLSLSITDEDEDAKVKIKAPKRKLKIKLKDSLQSIKRQRSAAPSSSTTADSASDRSTVDTCCTSNGGTSTDTIDSGVFLHLCPTEKFKFTSFKRNEKRKYRTRKSSTSSSLSSSDSE